MHKYGWKPDLPDFRDHKYTFTALDALPDIVDLRNEMPPVFNQGSLGSCVEHGTSCAIMISQKINNLPQFMPSRLFIYFESRLAETGDTNSDSGTSIRTAMKTCANVGFPPETDWIYDVSQFTIKPSSQAYTDAQNHKLINYKSVNQDLTDIKTALVNKFPVVFGATVYSSFEATKSDGIVNMPQPNEKCLGGHCMTIVGHNSLTKQFIVRNSWGEDWGDKGYCYFPEEYLLNPDMADDMWVINSLS